MLTRSTGYVAVLVGLALTAGLPALPAAAADPTPDSAIPVPYLPKDGAAKTPSRPAPPLPAATGARMKRQGDLLPAAQELARQARSADSDIAGVRVDASAGAVHVYRTDPKKPLALPAAVGSAGKVVVHSARFNRTRISQTVDAVTRDADALADRSVTVESVGPNVDGSGVSVSVVAADTAGVERAEKELRSRYGDIIARVNRVQPRAPEDSLFFAGPRFNDSEPWSGGDRIHSLDAGCTSGISALLNDAKVMLTAAHCGDIGTTFLNGPGYDGNYRVIGDMVYDNGDTDIGAIGVSDAWPFVNVGAAEDSYQVIIDSWATPVVGETLCQSGSYSGEVCDLEVVDTGQRTCLKRNIFGKCKQWSGNFADVINMNGPSVPAAGHGDSGAPVYQRGAPSAGYGSAVGLVHGTLTGNAAANFPDYYPPTLWCSAPEGWSQRCSAGFSFAHMPGY
jgi:hypothetical protein